MGWEAWVTLVTVLLILYALARDLAGADVVLMAAITILSALSPFSDRFPRPAESLGAFGNEALLTVGVLFIVAAGLTETGAITLITDRLLGRPKSLAIAQIRALIPVAGISAFMNNTPVVAVFVPVLRDWCRRTRLPPSKLMMPLSFAAVLGGVCTLIGTSTNLVVQGLLIELQATDPRVQPMGMFTLSAVGVPVAAIGLTYVIVASRWLLPSQRVAAETEDVREYTVEMMVKPASALVGQTIEEAGLRHLPNLYLARIERDGEALVAVEPDQRLHAHDRLVFVGVVDSVLDLHRMRGLVPATDQVFKLDQPRHHRSLIEAVVSDTSPLVGQTVREGRFRNRYNAVVIAVHRGGERINRKIGDIVLRTGDTLLLETYPWFAETHRNRRDFFLVSPVADSSPRRHHRAPVAIAILAVMVTLAAFEDVTRVGMLHLALLAAAGMMVTGCLSAAQAKQSIEPATLIAIGAAIGLGRIVQTSGLAHAAGLQMTTMLAGLGPWGVLAGVYALTLVFTELVTNNAAAALALPLAHAAATELDVNLMPFAVAVAVSASAGFATPLGYQTHLMVYAPGGYKFMDFVRFGIPLDLLAMAVTVGLAPVVFPF